MRSEREKFELAAKAAGMGDEWVYHRLGCGMVRYDGSGHAWNPRDDDGDALRLAVMLHMRVCTGQVDWAGGDRWIGEFSEPEHIAADPYAATRLAIFNAAVAIGAAMP